MIKNLIFITLSLFILSGCGASGVITDYGKQSTRVTGMKLSSGKTFDILTAGTLMQVPLTKVKSIRLHQDETKDYQKKLYCLAEVLFLDGTKVGTFNPNSNAAKAWVQSDMYIYAKTESGKFQILMNDVSKIDMTFQ